MNKKEILKTELLVLGGGPAGYTAALKAANLNIKVTLIDKFKNLGGVCLNSGCIPTKALLYISSQIDEMKNLNSIGVEHTINNINIKKIQKWKDEIIKKLNYDLQTSFKNKKINTLNAYGKFLTSHSVELLLDDKKYIIEFDNVIIATGTKEKKIKSNYGRLLNSYDALNLSYIPDRVLIVGSGFVGLEIATIFSSLNSHVDILDKKNNILPEFDDDIKKIFFENLKKKIHHIHLNMEISHIEEQDNIVLVKLNNNKIFRYDLVIFATGRYPNTNNLNLNNINIQLTNKQFIKINNKGQTNYKNIYACGDITGFPMLAHKAFYQAQCIIDIIAGNDVLIEDKFIPIVLYGVPEISQVGINEAMAKNLGIKYTIKRSFWNNNGKGVIINELDGLSKLIFNEDNIIIGGSIIGKYSSELLAELSLAIEMGCHKNDLSLTMHPHPTLSETIYSSLDTK